MKQRIDAFKSQREITPKGFLKHLNAAFESTFFLYDLCIFIFV